MASATPDLRLPSEPMAGTNLYCLVNIVPESLREAQRPGLERTTCRLQVRRPNHYATTPHTVYGSSMWVIAAAWKISFQDAGVRGFMDDSLMIMAI